MRSPLALCLVTVAVSGCGAAAPRDSAEEFSGEKRAVAAAIEAMETAARDNDTKRLCRRLLTPRLQAAVKEAGTDCVTAIRDSFKDAGSKDLTVDDVSISGNTATAKVISGAGSDEKTDTLKLEKIGADWRVASLLAS
jgi:hypothetical protein